MESLETPILSVTEISLSLKACVEQVFGHIRVRGEVVGVKRAPSGHTYFSLKDTDSVLSAVCWRGRDKTTMNALQDGLEIICTGKLSTYPGRSNYQMIVEQAEPAGIGALLKLLNDRKMKLEKEGLFDSSRKKPIPVLPRVIGVVTSPSGAVIRDIMHRLNDRFPRHVLLWPVLVQGEGAADQIAQAITGFNAIPVSGIQTATGFIPRPDLLIVARGGGSFEDLFCFNEENVVRAAAASDIPLISAVGHETDTTLIDYAADLRAPTPTGAAEKAVPVRAELALTLQTLQTRLSDGLFRLLKDNELKLMSLTRGMPKLSDVVNTFFERLDDRSIRLKNSATNYIKNLINQTDNLSKLLKSYSYNAVLERGFSLITDNHGHILASAPLAEQQSQFKITFFDGSIQAQPIPHSFLPSEKENLIPSHLTSVASDKTSHALKDIHCNSSYSLNDTEKIDLTNKTAPKEEQSYSNKTLNIAIEKANTTIHTTNTPTDMDTQKLSSLSPVTTAATADMTDIDLSSSHIEQTDKVSNIKNNVNYSTDTAFSSIVDQSGDVSDAQNAAATKPTRLDLSVNPTPTPRFDSSPQAVSADTDAKKESFVITKITSTHIPSDTTILPALSDQCTTIADQEETSTDKTTDISLKNQDVNPLSTKASEPHLPTASSPTTTKNHSKKPRSTASQQTTQLNLFDDLFK